MNKVIKTYHLGKNCAVLLARTAVFIALIIMSLNTTAQSIKDELKQITSLYADGTNSYDFTYKYYDKSGASSTGQTIQGSLKKKGNLYSYKIGDNHIIRNKHHILVMDQKNQVLMLDTVTTEMGIAQMMPLDSLLQYYSDMKRSVAGTNIIYNMQVDWRGGATVSMTVDKSNWHVLKIEITLNNDESEMEQGKMVMDFANVKLNTTIPPSEFSITKYIKQKNGAYEPMPAYGTWHFMNHLR